MAWASYHCQHDWGPLSPPPRPGIWIQASLKSAYSSFHIDPPGLQGPHNETSPDVFYHSQQGFPKTSPLFNLFERNKAVLVIGTNPITLSFWMDFILILVWNINRDVPWMIRGMMVWWWYILRFYFSAPICLHVSCCPEATSALSIMDEERSQVMPCQFLARTGL